VALIDDLEAQNSLLRSQLAVQQQANIELEESLML